MSSRSLNFIFLVCGACFAGATRLGAVAESDEVVPSPLVAMAASPMPTRSNSVYAPTSAMPAPDALALARSVAGQSGRDIIVSRVAATGSMRPFFDENAVLLLEAVPYDELKLGDVITYYHPELKVLVVHRLVEKRGDNFWARGDHNGGMDNIYVTRDSYRRRLAGVLYMSPQEKPKPAGKGEGRKGEKVFASEKSEKPEKAVIE
jgi:hypothetical protein